MNLNKVINFFGKTHQLEKAKEECLELAVSLQRYLKGGRDTEKDVIDEIADVSIMIQQLKLIFDSEKIDKRIEYKLERLENKINKEKGKHLGYIAKSLLPKNWR